MRILLSDITEVFRNGGTFTNGANFNFGGFSGFRYLFSVGFSRLTDETDFDPFISVSDFNPTASAPTAESVPEPATILGLLTFSNLPTVPPTRLSQLEQLVFLLVHPPKI